MTKMRPVRRWTDGTFSDSLRILLFGSSPFAASNSHSTPKFRRSLTFPLLPNYPALPFPMVAPVLAQLSSAPRNVRPPSMLNGFRVPPVATGAGTFPPLVFQASRLQYPASSPNPRRLILLQTLLRSQKSQLLWNQANPHSLCKTPGVGVSPQSSPLVNARTFNRANSFVCIGLPPLCALLSLFSALVSFVFNRLQPLFRKHPGWGACMRNPG